MKLIDAGTAKDKVTVCINSNIFGDEDEQMLIFLQRISELVKTALDEAPTVDAIPIDVLKQELSGIAAANQCGQGSSYDRELGRAIKTVLEWRESPAYQMRLESMRRFGWKV